MTFIYKENILKWNTTVPYRAHQNLLEQYFIYQLIFLQCSGYGQMRFGHYMAIISGNSS
jgi:hypothetical protein